LGNFHNKGITLQGYVSEMVEATTDSLKERAQVLHGKVKATEHRLAEIAQELGSMPGKPGLDGKLVDGEVRGCMFVCCARALGLKSSVCRLDLLSSACPPSACRVGKVLRSKLARR
jgi:hypothetical protein